MTKVSNERTSVYLKQIYNFYRTALLNKKYYGHRLESYQVWSTRIEVVIAFGASGSSVTGWAVWGSEAGKTVWMIIAALSAILAIIYPFIQFSKKIELYSKLYTAHSELYAEANQIVGEVERQCSISEKILRRFSKLENKFGELGNLDDPKPVKRLIKRYTNEVNKAIPVRTLWYP